MPLRKTIFFFLSSSFSHIGFFLTSNSIISNISESVIHPILISDHTPVTLTWNTSRPHKHNTRWCFNTSLLNDPEFDSLIKREWASFLEINDSPESSSSILWETGKAVLRGIIISFSTHKKKIEQRQEAESEQKIKQLEGINANDQTETTQTELRKYKFKLNEIINKKTQFQIHRLREEQYHHSNKSGKFLVNLIKQNKEKTTISTIRDPAGKPTQSPEDIHQIFRDFYAELNLPEIDPTQDNIKLFLNNINLHSCLLTKSLHLNHL